MHSINKEIDNYHQTLSETEQSICKQLQETIDSHLKNAARKIWHGHPVWFIDENPIVGYSKQKMGLRLIFWSGASFEEEGLEASSGKFKDASIMYTDPSEINSKDLKRWLKKSISIQWDYKNLVKRKGVLERLK